MLRYDFSKKKFKCILFYVMLLDAESMNCYIREEKSERTASGTTGWVEGSRAESAEDLR